MSERRRNRFLFLLLSLLFLFLIEPFLGPSLLHQTIALAGLTAVLVSSVYSVSGQNRLLRAGIVLLIPVLVANWATHALAVDLPALVAGARLLIALFLVLTAISVLHAIASEREVTVDTIYGSACGYMLLGVVFALLFTAIEVLQPGSFQLGTDTVGVGRTADVESALIPQMLYYSFVTLTTLGYGDITPLTRATGSLATLEALSGQFYIAVLVARLVAIQVASAAAERMANR